MGDTDPLDSDSLITGIADARHFKYLKEELVVVPTKEIASSYDEVVSRDYQTIHNNRKQIRLLTEARDRLLPRLMGGGMEVDAPKGQRAINPVHRSGRPEGAKK